MQFYQEEPFGLAVQDAAQAHIASIIANANRDTKKRPKPFSYTDFLLFVDRKKEESKLPDDPNARTEAMISRMFGGLQVNRLDK